ncbi:Ubiquitin-like superfamily protein [Thalictrum thalictroides]|uniref:Ubiquitin-like superfamily protein n=1 Tax=Thalictrum thalictroides TaxID=46969 RepID=A0A7J6W2V0_THATH|nr:Ubiquitin-like superfamily protein [Thalictrum thalictroides]
MAMYIRVKRDKTTYFVQCDPTETSLDIKQKLHGLIDQPVTDQRLILVASGEVLDDSKTMADQKVENDAVVALTLRKDDKEFEDVSILQPDDDFYHSRDGDGASWFGFDKFQVGCKCISLVICGCAAEFSDINMDEHKLYLSLLFL